MSTSQSIPSPSILRRAIKEFIARDWFDTLDIEIKSPENVILTNKYGDTEGITNDVILPDENNVASETSRKKIIIYSSVGSQISPSLIEALIISKIIYLIRMLQSTLQSSRLNTSSGEDVDAWAAQLYGDLIVRREMESDNTLRERIKCLINHNDFHFQPVPTDEGIPEYLACFGFTISIPPTTPYGTLDNGFYWFSELDVDNQPPYNRNATCWETDLPFPDAGLLKSGRMIWSGESGGGVIFVQDEGDEGRNQTVDSLIRRAKPFGIVMQVNIGTF